PHLLLEEPGHDLVDVRSRVEVLAAGLAELRAEAPLREHDDELLLPARLQLLLGLVEGDVPNRRRVLGPWRQLALGEPGAIPLLPVGPRRAQILRARRGIRELAPAGERPRARGLGEAVEEDEDLDRLRRVERVGDEHDRLALRGLRRERVDVGALETAPAGL